jgi:hypothetical protein
VGAASSRDHLIRGWKPLPQGIFYGNLDFPAKRLIFLFEVVLYQSLPKKGHSQ